ncbi:MAG: hypothetical protein ACK5LO_02435 [Leucobacter sp.]
MARKVVASYTDAPETRFEVEYRDGEGEWLPAVGVWGAGVLRCAASYPFDPAAKFVAAQIRTLCGHATRVVEVTGE